MRLESLSFFTKRLVNIISVKAQINLISIEVCRSICGLSRRIDDQRTKMMSCQTILLKHRHFENMNSVFQNSRINSSMAHVRPELLFIRGCKPKCTLQRYRSEFQNQRIFWRKIDILTEISIFSRRLYTPDLGQRAETHILVRQ